MTAYLAFIKRLILNFLDDTYMYDDVILPNRGVYAAGPYHKHWYDEPPYERDPDDFLTNTSDEAEARIEVRNFVVFFSTHIYLT